MSATLLVIFGAGASFDSVPDVPGWANRDWRPPLASELFSARQSFGQVMAQFRDAIPLIGEMRSLVRKGVEVEQGLQAISERAEHYEPLLPQLAALQFYIQEVVWRCGAEWGSAANGLTNYVVMASALEEWRARSQSRILYATFNYDLLLEEACAHLRFADPSHYIASDHTKVYKLHGSVNWGREIVGEQSRHIGDSRAQIAASVRGLDISGKYRIQSHWADPTHEGTRLFPVVALPTKSKSIFACPEDHLESLKAELETVTHVLVVGWRAQEQHFLAMLHDHLRPGLPAHIVGRSPQGTIAVSDSLAAGGIKLAAGMQPIGFSGYVDEIQKAVELVSLPIRARATTNRGA